MPSILNPYLSFRGQAREAMEFYKSVFGGELTLNTFGEYGGAGMPTDPSEDNLVMHSQLTAPNGMTLMGADVPASMEFSPGNSISVSLSGEDEGELRGYYDQLVAGGTVGVPMEKAPWGDVFGMCTDQFGINWLVNVSQPAA